MAATRLVVDIDKILAEKPSISFVELLASPALHAHCLFHEEVFLTYTDVDGLRVTIQVIRPMKLNEMPPQEGSH